MKEGCPVGVEGIVNSQQPGWNRLRKWTNLSGSSYLRQSRGQLAVEHTFGTRHAYNSHLLVFAQQLSAMCCRVGQSPSHACIPRQRTSPRMPAYTAISRLMAGCACNQSAAHSQRRQSYLESIALAICDLLQSPLLIRRRPALLPTRSPAVVGRP